jgi:hypothetical protein
MGSEVYPDVGVTNVMVAIVVPCMSIGTRENGYMF